MLASTTRQPPVRDGATVLSDASFRTARPSSDPTVRGVACGSHHEMQRYSGYAQDARAAQDRVRLHTQQAFGSDFERSYTPYTPAQQYRVPTLWECVKSAFRASHV